MKIRFILSALTLIGWGITDKLFKLFYAPITATATANQLNDDLAAYGWAKFVREGGVESMLFYITLLVLLAIWFWPKRKNASQ
jgi:hypothetical protein